MTTNLLPGLRGESLGNRTPMDEWRKNTTLLWTANLKDLTSGDSVTYNVKNNITLMFGEISYLDDYVLDMLERNFIVEQCEYHDAVQLRTSDKLKFERVSNPLERPSSAIELTGTGIVTTNPAIVAELPYIYAVYSVLRRHAVSPLYYSVLAQKVLDLREIIKAEALPNDGLIRKPEFCVSQVLGVPNPTKEEAPLPVPIDNTNFSLGNWFISRTESPKTIVMYANAKGPINHVVEYDERYGLDLIKSAFHVGGKSLKEPEVIISSLDDIDFIFIEEK